MFTSVYILEFWNRCGLCTFYNFQNLVEKKILLLLLAIN